MEQLFERYNELEQRNFEELEHDKSITHLLYIDGFKWDDMEKIKKINKISQSKIDKRITLVQDFGMLRKDIECNDNQNCHQLLKDIDMMINSIMFEIDKLEQLRQKSQRFLRLQSQPNIKPDTAPTDIMGMTNGGGILSSTSDGQSRMYKSSFQFYRAQRDQQIQSHNQKWIEKQYSIQKKLINDELSFQQFRVEIEEKQQKAETNLNEYQKWQTRVLQEQSDINSKRLQSHKDKMMKEQQEKQIILLEKLSTKEKQLEKQKILLKDYHEEIKKKKEMHFQQILQKSMGALNDKDKFNQYQKEQSDKKELENLHKLKYIEESKQWTKTQLQKQAEKKQEKIEKANQILIQQDYIRRQKFEEKEAKHQQYIQNYTKVFSEYQDKLIKDKDSKLKRILVNKAFEDASREQYAKFIFERRANSQVQAQRLKERRLKIIQEEKAGEHLIKQLEINSRLQELEYEFEIKRQKQQRIEDEQKLRQQMIENDEKQIMREREINARKLEKEKEQRELEKRQIKYQKV